MKTEIVNIDLNKVDWLIRQKGINYSKLAEECGIAHNSYSNIKKRGYCSKPVAVSIAFVLGTTVQDITKTEKEPEPTKNDVSNQLEQISIQLEELIGIADAIRKAWNVELGNGN